MRHLAILMRSIISVIVLMIFIGCQGIVDDIMKSSTITVEVEEELFNNSTVAASVKSIPLVNGLRMSKPLYALGKVSKTTESSFNVTKDEAWMLAVDARHAELSGKITNNGTTTQTFDVYFSNQTGLMNPSTEGIKIATTTLNPGENVITQETPGFKDEIAPHIQEYFANHQDLSTVFVYFVISANSEVDVIVNDLSIILGALYVEYEEINLDELDEYPYQVDEIKGGNITGNVQNDGSGTIGVRVYVMKNVSLELVADEIVESGNLDTIDPVTDGEVKINNAIDFVQDGGKVMAVLGMISAYDIDVNLQSLGLCGTVTFKTEE